MLFKHMNNYLKNCRKKKFNLKIKKDKFIELIQIMKNN